MRFSTMVPSSDRTPQYSDSLCLFLLAESHQVVAHLTMWMPPLLSTVSPVFPCLLCSASQSLAHCSGSEPM